MSEDLKHEQTDRFWVCSKLSAAEKVKPDCCHTPAVVSTLLTPLPVSCPLTTPHHYIIIIIMAITEDEVEYQRLLGEKRKELAAMMIHEE